MFRDGYPGPRDTRLGPGLYWARGAQGRLEPDVATALAFAYLRAARRSRAWNFPPIIITQGAYNAPTPGEAHDDGGAVDLRVRHLTPDERSILTTALTEVGFAVYELIDPPYTPHIHAIFTHADGLNRTAKVQVAHAPHKPPSGDS